MTKTKLNDTTIRNLKPRDRAYLVWDAHQRGLAVQVQPTGHKAYKQIYSYCGRPRWYTIGTVGAIGLSDARRLAAGIMLRVAEGKDPAAERRAHRDADTFGDLARRHLEEHAKKKNKSWEHTYRLVERNLLPRWGRLKAADISRADVELLGGKLADRPSLCNQVLAAASSIFTFGVRKGVVPLNPCSNAERQDTAARERTLSDSELPLFWKAFDGQGLRGVALKMLLLTGQRPGEIAAMRSEDIVDGWWEMPGEAVEEWPGTKNGMSHRVWLPKAARALLEEVGAEGRVFDVANLDQAMRAICRELKTKVKVTPHDLRRTHGTTVTRLGFGRDAMDRIQNHKGRGVTDVYDRHSYATENQTVMEAVAEHLLRVVAGESEAKVLRFVK